MSHRIHLFASVLVLVDLFAWAASDEPHVRDLPIPEGATEVTIMKRRGDIRFMVESDVKPTGDFYAMRLAAQGWTKSGKDNVQRTFWVQKFAKGKSSLEVRVDRREGGSEVRLTPKGMLWDEDLAPHARDLPIPDDATDVEYEDFFERIEFNCPLSVKAAADFLSENLEKSEWTESGAGQVTERFVRLERTKGRSSLSIDIRAEETGSRVSIRTKGMNWAGIKETNERTKKSSTKSAAVSPPKAKPVEEAAPPPKRKDKPKQGIAALPNLPNEATITMDGKTFKLTSVIAYEVFSRGEWSTKVIATQKPIKQETLLAKLKNHGKDNIQIEQPGDGLNLPQPFLQLDLDDDDRPQRMSLRADNIPGSGSSNELSGTALVEDGRARGTVKLKEPGEFFDKVYLAEISFDVSVLTRESTPAKRLTESPKLPNSGTLTMGNQVYKLSNVVAYEMKRFDEPVTVVVISEKSLNMTKLNAALGKKSIEEYFEFTPQVKLTVDDADNVSSMFIWADNISISSNSDLIADIVIEDGRARGTAKMTKPDEFFDKKYTFELSFDVNVLSSQATQKSNSPASGLVADSYDGLPIPEGRQNISSAGSKFRKEINATVSAKLDAVVRFYRDELTAGGWKETFQEAKVEQGSAKVAFTSPTGSLSVQLKAESNQTAITLILRDVQATKAAGLLPAPGKARLVLGNDSETAATVTINKRDYSIAAGAGAKDPKTGLNWDLAPGKYTVEVKLPGGEVQIEELTIGPDETWGVVVIPVSGFLAMQLY
jgi:hypothetical protein